MCVHVCVCVCVHVRVCVRVYVHVHVFMLCVHVCMHVISRKIKAAHSAHTEMYSQDLLHEYEYEADDNCTSTMKNSWVPAEF